MPVDLASPENEPSVQTSTVKVYVVRPRGIGEGKKRGAVVWAHGGGAILFHAEMFNHEMCKLACTAQCVVFSVDYRKAPEYKCPVGQLDFAHGVRYVYQNADALGIDRTKICASGTSGGGWICLGAAYWMMKRSEQYMIKALFLICPMISD